MNEEKQQSILQMIPWPIKLTLATVIVFMLLSIFWPFKIIDATERGLRFRFGSLQEKVEEDGLAWRIPIYERIEAVNIQPIQLDHRVAVNSDGAITKDNQTIGADMTIFYKYKQNELVRMWRDFGKDNIKSIINQTLRETFKAVVGKYDIFQLAMTQDEIRAKVWDELQVKLASYPFEVTELKIVNYDWSEAFDAQISETMSRAQQVKQKEQEKLMAEQEAGKGIVQAEAQKKIAITTAEGEKQAVITKAEGVKESAKLMADAKALEGEGIKKYNESVATNWDIELKKMQLNIDLKKVEKWNGQYVPNNMYGPIPFDTQGGVQGK